MQLHEYMEKLHLNKLLQLKEIQCDNGISRDKLIVTSSARRGHSCQFARRVREACFQRSACAPPKPACRSPNAVYCSFFPFQHEHVKSWKGHKPRIREALIKKCEK